MIVKFVCLANSFKEGGRCLAGVEIDDNNNPVMQSGHPKWIRPVSHSPHGEVRTNLVSHFNILDIIELDVTGFPEANNYQSENAFFREDSLSVVGSYNINNLAKLSDTRSLIFANRGKAVPEERIGDLTYSLLLIKTNNFEIIEKQYDDTHRSQLRLVFTYNGNQYDFPVTDPVFLHRHQLNPDLLENQTELYLSLSLAVVYNDWYYKLVAGIIY
jgi:hypothetical protein